MAMVTIDALKTKTAKLKKALAEKGESLDGAKTRAVKKQIRRAQRRRRTFERAAKKAAGAGKKSE